MDLSEVLISLQHKPLVKYRQNQNNFVFFWNKHYLVFV